MSTEQPRQGPEQQIPRVDAVDLLPELLKPGVATICWGKRDPKEGNPANEDVFNLEGLIIGPGECLMLYGSNTREDAFRRWEERGPKSVHLSGGFGNPMTLESNFFGSLPAAPFIERTIGDIKEALKSSDRPPIYFDYLDAFRRQAEKEKIADMDSLDSFPINETLGWPATEYWEMLAAIEGKTINLGKITSRDFVTGYGNGFIVVEKNPKFGDQEVDFTISNTTGAGGLETKLGNHLIVFLTKGEDAARERYIREARFTANMLRDQNKPVPFDTTRLDEYAEGFVKSARTVEEDLKEVFGKYNGRDLRGIQFAFNTIATDRIGMAVYPYPSHMPHAFVKEGNLWKPA